jgi:hypothetical protein
MNSDATGQVVVRLFFSMKNVIHISVLFAVLFVSARTTMACRCAMPTVKGAFNNSKIVFSGTVVAVESDGVIFTVDQLWKGAASERIKVYVRDLRTSCDPGVEVGRTLLVYAYPGDSRLPLVAQYCRRTRVLTKRDNETDELDTLRSSANVRRTTNRWTGAAETKDEGGRMKDAKGVSTQGYRFHPFAFILHPF